MAPPATPEIPLPCSVLKLLLLEALEKPSLYEFSLLLPRLGNRLELDMAGKPGVSVHRMAEALRSGVGNQWKMVVLLCSMDRRVISSILRGTVGYDVYHNGTRDGWYPTPTADGEQGIYIASLVKTGADGKFLNLRETEKLAKGISDYLEGARVMAIPGPHDDEQKRQIEWVKAVDSRSGVANPKSPTRAALISQQAGAMRALLDSFQQRVRAVKPLDPTGKVRQIQAPVYVGCSINLKGRISQYGTLKDVNKPLALTLAVLNMLDIAVTMQHTIAIRVWDSNQLKFAEQLVTALAGSLVYLSGFNVAEPGDNESKPTNWQSARMTVLGATPHVEENLMELHEEAQKRLLFRQKLAELDHDWQKNEERVTDMELKLDEAKLLFAMPWKDRRKNMLATNELLRARYLDLWTLVASWAFLHPEVYAAAQQEMATRGFRLHQGPMPGP